MERIEKHVQSNGKRRNGPTQTRKLSHYFG